MWLKEKPNETRTYGRFVTRVTATVVILVLGAVAVSAQDFTGRRAQPAGFSAGVMIGEPTGLTAKLWLSQTSALDLAVAWSFVGTGRVYVHGDYLVHSNNVLRDVPGTTLLYGGVGAKLLIADNPVIGVRIPLGVTYLFGNVPLELFLEIAPGLRLLPETQFDGGAGIGIRYQFR